MLAAQDYVRIAGHSTISIPKSSHRLVDLDPSTNFWRYQHNHSAINTGVVSGFIAISTFLNSEAACQTAKSNAAL
jgi:hypothetical protein